MAYTSPGTGPTIVQLPLMLRTTAILSPSGPAPGQVTAQIGHLPDKGILKVTTVPNVDGAARVIMPATTAASMTMEIQVAGTGTPMLLGSGILAPMTAGIGMTQIGRAHV